MVSVNLTSPHFSNFILLLTAGKGVTASKTRVCYYQMKALAKSSEHNLFNFNCFPFLTPLIHPLGNFHYHVPQLIHLPHRPHPFLLRAPGIIKRNTQSVLNSVGLSSLGEFLLNILSPNDLTDPEPFCMRWQWQIQGHNSTPVYTQLVLATACYGSKRCECRGTVPTQDSRNYSAAAASTQ